MDVANRVETVTGSSLTFAVGDRGVIAEPSIVVNAFHVANMVPNATQMLVYQTVRSGLDTVFEGPGVVPWTWTPTMNMPAVFGVYTFFNGDTPALFCRLFVECPYQLFTMRVGVKPAPGDLPSLITRANTEHAA